jgi:hypothetical protein
MSELAVASGAPATEGGPNAREMRPPTGLSSSPLYFKVLMKELKERTKECDALSIFLDEFASVEETFGKSLVKVIDCLHFALMPSPRLTFS